MTKGQILATPNAAMGVLDESHNGAWMRGSDLVRRRNTDIIVIPVNHSKSTIFMGTVYITYIYIYLNVKLQIIII